ncbi:unnamed protein product, partial [Prorocentrum cordatum]
RSSHMVGREIEMLDSYDDLKVGTYAQVKAVMYVNDQEVMMVNRTLLPVRLLGKAWRFSRRPAEATEADAEADAEVTAAGTAAGASEVASAVESFLARFPVDDEAKEMLREAAPDVQAAVLGHLGPLVGAAAPAVERGAPGEEASGGSQVPPAAAAPAAPPLPAGGAPEEALLGPRCVMMEGGELAACGEVVERLLGDQVVALSVEGDLSRAGRVSVLAVSCRR